MSAKLVSVGMLALGIAFSNLHTAGAQTIELKYATANARPHVANTIADFFKKEIEARTNGDVRVKLFEGGQLGSQTDQIELAQMGTIDVTTAIVQNIVPFINDFQVFSLAYLFPDYESFGRVVANDSPVFKHFAKQINDHLDGRLLSLSGGGTRSMSTKNKPIKTPAEIAGWKFRIGASPMMGKIWRALGTVPVVVPFSEVYTGLQTGLAEASEHSISAYYGKKLYEVSPVLIKTQHEYLVAATWISNKTFNKLPKKYQDLIDEVGAKTTKVGIDYGINADESLIKTLVAKHGVTVVEPEKAKFIEILKPLHQDLAKEMNIVVVYEMIQAASKSK